MSRLRLLTFLIVLAVAAYAATARDGSGGPPAGGQNSDASVVRIVDVGVAGIHRLLKRRAELFADGYDPTRASL